MKKVHKESAIIFNQRISGAWKTIRVEPIAVRLVVFLVPRVIDLERIRGWQLTNNNSIHCVGLVVGLQHVPVLFVIEIGKRENRDPRTLVVADAMNKEKWSDKMT